MTFESEICRLCRQECLQFYSGKTGTYFKCSTCKGIFCGSKFLPDPKAELIRYKQHNNDVDDPNYKSFVSPITEAVKHHFDKKDQGLDFGSGPGPVIYHSLKKDNYNIQTYDPFFNHRPEVFNHTFDYIICCEVAEHFHQPWEEFQKLSTLLKKDGKIFIMTDLYNDKISFKDWYYKNDLTHVFFYQKQTFSWIQTNLNYESVEFSNRLITLTS